MVRTLDGQARAFLSDRYRRLDNYDLCEHVLPMLQRLPDASSNPPSSRRRACT
ncbi:MAG: hypothetical protein IPP44_22195 [Ideonella sp.]|nr:hypothetical protein [Ideonella sp.]